MSFFGKIVNGELYISEVNSVLSFYKSVESDESSETGKKQHKQIPETVSTYLSKLPTTQSELDVLWCWRF